MRSANVPADDDAHRSSRRPLGPETRSEGRRQQAEDAGGRKRLIVVKLGGSHAFAPELRTWLGAIAEARGRAVIVPGGGPFANAVRAAQAGMGFDERAAHAMAMMAMAQFGRALMSFEPTIRLATSRAAIRHALREGMIPVWSPEAMATAAGLPETWELTSDSLAAWLAGSLGAESLFLIKHGRFDGRTLDARDLAARGVVDPLFPHYLLRSGARAYLAAPEQAEHFSRELLRSTFPEIVTPVEASEDAR
jgi:5-(aminomethyl)-3-furanmethanol phosphate kinase